LPAILSVPSLPFPLFLVVPLVAVSCGLLLCGASPFASGVLRAPSSWDWVKPFGLSHQPIPFAFPSLSLLLSFLFASPAWLPALAGAFVFTPFWPSAVFCMKLSLVVVRFNNSIALGVEDMPGLPLLVPGVGRPAPVLDDQRSPLRLVVFLYLLEFRFNCLPVEGGLDLQSQFWIFCRSGERPSSNGGCVHLGSSPMMLKEEL
jgi:hypothetical protein